LVLFRGLYPISAKKYMSKKIKAGGGMYPPHPLLPLSSPKRWLSVLAKGEEATTNTE
jgi:hypothetical protein